MIANMFKTPQLVVGSIIYRPALINLDQGLIPLTVTATLEKTPIHNGNTIIGHLVYAVAGDLTATGVAPRRFSDGRPGWRALEREVLNPKKGTPLGARVYLANDLPRDWTTIKIVNTIKHRWTELVDGQAVPKTFVEYRGVAASDPSAFVNYYREAYMVDIGTDPVNMSNTLRHELDKVFNEDEVRDKLSGDTPRLQRA